MNSRSFRSGMAVVRKYLASDKGNVGMMAAGASVLILGVGSLAVDWGSLTLEHRRAQNLADLTAMSAAANIENYDTIVRTMLADNGYEDTTLILNDPAAYAALKPEGDSLIAHVELGSYIADRTIEAPNRFQPGIKPFDAVRVTKRQLGSLHFAKGIGKPDPVIETQALARAKKTASLSIGSRLLRIEDGVLNELLGAALGSEISLTAADYDALLDTQISIGSLLDDNRAHLGLTAATFDELLDAELTFDDFAKALRADSHMSAPAGSALSSLIGDSDSRTKFSLSDLLDADSLTASGGVHRDAVLGIEVSALRALTAAAFAASGDHQIEFTLGLDNLPNARVDVALAVGEKEKLLTGISQGGEGAVAETAQIRLSLNARIGGEGLLQSTTLQVPVIVEVASGKARLSELQCNRKNPNRSKAIVEARPGLVSAYIGTPRDPIAADFDSDLDVDPATVLDLSALKIRARSEVEVGNATHSTLTFNGPDIDSGTKKRVSTTDVAQSLTLSLIENTDLEISALGSLFASRRLLQNALTSQLGALASPLDDITANLLATLGVSVGEVDVAVQNLQCDQSKLVQ